MTWGLGVALLLALVGALCFAGASVLQHDAVRTAPRGTVGTGGTGGARGAGGTGPGHRDGGALSPRRLVAIMRRPRWLAGLGLAGVGSVVHAVALVLAPLRVVQPVGVLAVPFAVLLAGARSGRRPTAGVVAGAGLCVAGVTVVVLASAGSTTSHPPSGGATLVASLTVGVVVALLTVVGLRSGTGRRCVLMALAGASAFGLGSALVRAVSQSVAAGDVELLDAPVLAAAAGLVVALVVGGWLVQQAYHAGSPEVVVACLTVVDPLVAVLLGALVLGEGAATPATTWALLATAAVAASAGVTTLAHHHPDAVAARAATSTAGAAPAPSAVHPPPTLPRSAP